MASSTDIEDFLTGPLVTWLKTCVEDIDNKLDNYENYFDGFPFREVLLKIDPDPSEPIQSLSSFVYDVNIITARIQIFHAILNHIQSIYLSELRQVPVTLPDIVILSREPSSRSALDQLKLMIVLLLGAAVQGPTRDFFVNKITGLTEDKQFGIVGYIQQITNTNKIVLNCETLQVTSELIYEPIQNLAQERNRWMSQWVSDMKKRSTDNSGWQDSDKDNLAVDATHLAVEIVEYKSQIRRLKQTIDERSDHILEISEELEKAKLQNLKLQIENNKLNADIKKADRAQDEWDDLKDKAAKSESLEKEVITLRRNLIDAKSNRNRLDEVLADKKVLERSLETLEIQLNEARKKAKGIFEAERKLIDSEKIINDLELELDAYKTKVQELEEQNLELQQVARNTVHESDIEEDGSFEVDDSKSFYECSGNTSIGEELNNNVQARALRLQLENRKMQILIDSLKQKNFYETGNQILELEKEKKKLSLRCDKLQSECDRLRENNLAVENLFQKTIDENEKLQSNLDSLRISSDKQAHDLQVEMARQEDLLQSLDHLMKEKEKVLTLIDSIKNRADKAEKSNADLKDTIEDFKKDIARYKQIERANEQLNDKLETLEKENGNLLKEVVKTRELLEVKSVDLDQQTEKITILERQLEALSKEKSEMMEQVEKLQDCERKAQELLSHAEMHAETISTLQKDLVTEKVNNEKFRSNVEKLGLSLDVLENDINVVLEKMLDNLEISKTLTAIYKTKDNGVLEEHLEEMASSLTEEWRQQVEKLETEIAALQSSNEFLKTENATLQVDISTLNSQLQSLHMQQTALQLANSQLVAEKEDNNKLNADIKKADRAQDEWDDLKDKAAKSESLEKEVITLRRNLIDAKSNRNRLDEVLADKKVLERSLETLEIQLNEARKKAKGIFEAERKLIDSEKIINDLELELDAYKTKVQELEEQNLELQQVARNTVHESDIEEDGSFEVDDSKSFYECSGNTSIGEELNNNVQARALRLQLENRKMQILIDSLKQKNFYETGNQILELEKEKKKLSLRCDKLQSECDRLRENNLAVENLFQKTIDENEKLQSNLDSLRISSDKQAHDLQVEMARQEDLLQSLDHLMKEKEKVLTLIDSIKNRADKAEKSNADLKDTIEDFKKDIARYKQIERANEQLNDKLETLEKENGNLLKEVVKTRELLEVKSVDLDQQTEKITILERQLEALSKEKSEMMEQVEKLQDCERKAQELLSHAEMHAETISTLQKDLVTEKVNNEKFRSNVEKLGLSLDVLENDINVVLEKMLDNLEISKTLTAIYKTKDNGVLEEHLEEMASSLTEEWRQQVEKLETEIAALQSSNEFLKTENATLQVDISTLNSQLQSLHMQQTALQLANSQLVAEKEDLFRQNLMQQSQHKALAHDQGILSNIHAELTAEYEKLRSEKEDLKKNNRDLKTEVVTYKEKVKSLENQFETLKQEKEKQIKDASDLALLRDEHSKLRRDFRILLTTNGQCYAELKCSREELGTLRTEFRELKATNAEMKSELDTKSDTISNFQLENAVLQQRCEMLQENLNKLDLTRISLLDSFSELCKQSLVCMADSMDKQNVSQMEAKHHWEQYNNILRQKDKLEEKIFDFYKKLDNVNTKKGGFASLVRRVRKAGSGIMSRSRSVSMRLGFNNRRSSEEETPPRAITAEPQVAGPSCSGSGESNNSSNGNESDNSTEDSILRAEPFRRGQHGGSLHGHKPRDEIALRRSQRQLSRRNSIASEEQLLRDSPSLGSIGSRRTVYISEDEPAPSPTPIQSTPLRDTNPPLLVYNRISTVIGGDTLCTLGNQTNLPEIPRDNVDSKKPANPKETAVWYEYGCV